MRTVFKFSYLCVFIYCLGCAKEDTLITEVKAGFSADTSLVVLNNYVDFSDKSSGDPDSWQWSFEGGQPSTSTEQNPTVTYSFKGEYNVSLKVSNEYSEDTILFENYISVINSLSANFDSDTTSIYTENNVQFYDSSVGDATSWLWTFEGGEPSSSTEQNPTVEYSSTGEYDVSLIVSNAYLQDTITIENYITVSKIIIPNEFNIVGTWEMVESNNSELNGMEVTVNNEETEAEIIYTPSSSFTIGDLKWKNLEKTSEHEYSYSEKTSSGTYSNDYNIFIVANGNELIIGNYNESTAGSFQRWARVDFQYPEDEDYELNGTWERTKSNNSNLDGMLVSINDSQTEGTIEYSPDETSFTAGKLKWINITKEDKNRYIFDDLVTNGNYTESRLFFTTNGKEFVIGVFSTNAGSFQKWTKDE